MKISFFFLFLPFLMLVLAAGIRLCHHFKILKVHKNSTPEKREEARGHVEMMFGVMFWIFFSAVLVDFSIFEQFDKYFATNINNYYQHQTAFIKEN